MEISLSAFFASGIAVTVMTVFLYILLKKNKRVSRFGVVCLYLCVVLVLARGFMPFDLCGRSFENENGMLEKGIHLTKSYYSTRLLPFLVTCFQRRVFSIAGVSVTLGMIIMSVWVLGIAGFLWRWIAGLIACKEELARMSWVETAGRKAVFGKVFKELFPGKEDRCTVVSSDLFGSAAVFGVRRPIIIVPDAEYSDEDLYFIFRHELFHVKHKDHLIKNLCAFLAAIYWWDPIISCLLPKIVAQAQELLVDHSVTKTLGPEEKLRYLECIRKTVQHTLAGRSGKMRVHALGKSGGKLEVLQRFHVMLTQDARGYTWKGIFLSLTIFLLSFTFVFEPLFKPIYDEDGFELFNLIQDHSYFIRKGEIYDLYLDGHYFSTYKRSQEIHTEFKNLPIYEEDEK